MRPRPQRLLRLGLGVVLAAIPAGVATAQQTATPPPPIASPATTQQAAPPDAVGENEGQAATQPPGQPAPDTHAQPPTANEAGMPARGATSERGPGTPAERPGTVDEGRVMLPAQDGPPAATDGAAAEPTPEADAAPAVETSPALASVPTAGPAERKHAVVIRLEALAGLGIGTRGLQVPTETGVTRLDDTSFAAADLALRLHLLPQQTLSFVFLLRYQTSLGLSVQEQQPFAVHPTVDVRASRVELTVAPTLRLGEGNGSPSLALPIGLSMRAFWPDFRELTTPAYSLFGPHLRAQLIAPITDGLSLRVAPEAQFIVLVDDFLKRQGTRGQGIALGVEAALTLRLNDALAIELSYRESHASVTNRAKGADLEDVERFATAGLVGAL